MQQNQRRALAPAELVLDSAMKFNFLSNLFSRAAIASQSTVGFRP
jgi:hypothetical protein